MKNLIKQRQSDIDKWVPAVLFQGMHDTDAETETLKPVRVNDGSMCGVCQEPDVHDEGLLDGNRYYLCYNCGNEPTEKEWT